MDMKISKENCSIIFCIQLLLNLLNNIRLIYKIKEIILMYKNTLIGTKYVDIKVNY